MLFLLFILTVLLNPKSYAKRLQVDFAVGAQASHEESLDAVDWGVSLKSHMTYYTEGFMQYGLFLNTDSPSNIILSDNILGFGVRFGEKLYMEFDVGWRYSAIFGSGISIIAGPGYRINNSFSLFFPFVLKDYGNLVFVPHVGFRL